MIPRPAVHTREQRFCGIWYDCAEFTCRTSGLIPSAELLAQLTAPDSGEAEAAVLAAARKAVAP
jgi:hypothetical protein